MNRTNTTQTGHRNGPVVTVDVGHVHLVTCDKRVAVKKHVDTRRQWNQMTVEQKTHDALAERCQRMHHTMYYLQ